MIYNTTFDLCAVIIYLFTHYYVITKKNTHKSQNKIFFFIIINGILCSVCDFSNASILNYLTVNPDAERTFLLRVILLTTMYIYTAMHNTLPALFFLYTLEVTNKNTAQNREHLRLLAIPLVLALMFIALNPFMHGIFYFDENLVYHRGIFMYGLYLAGIFYTVAALYFVIRFHADVPNNKNTTLILFIVTSFVGAIMQLIFPAFLLELFVESIAFLCILFTIENDDEIYNGITKIFNRRAFLSDTASAFASGDKRLLLILKLTNLRYYQAVLGISFTNDVLRNIASKLTELSETTDVYDCENGNFAVLYPGSEANRLSKLEDAVSAQFTKGWVHNNITLNFKTLQYAITLPDDIDNLETLVSLIDTETDYSKAVTKNTCIHGKEVSFLQREQKIERAIQKALDNKSLKVFYQPIWDKEANKIHSAEALVRLYDEELGFIPPDEFIPIAERNNSITEIGEFVFEQTVRMFSEKNVHQFGIKFIEVNLSPVQFMHTDLAERFKKILEEHEVNAPSINLEITESAAINDSDSFTQTMQTLRNMGFTFSLDDYGTGYSNASHIFNLDFDIIKLDKSILWKADQKASAKIILRNTIQMIKEMNLKIVMEGVETDAQKQTISSLGCDYIQGFYFSKPMEANQFIEYCKKFNKV